MAWRVAGSLIRLRDQINAFAPGRSKISDGTIGDTAHAGSASDHNPNGAGVVCAMDITHDPNGGLDAHRLADHLIANRNNQLKYIVSNRRIASALTGWRWVAYNGSNPHTSHIHISVGVGNDGASQPPYDNTQDWSINYNGATPTPPSGGGNGMEKMDDDTSRQIAFYYLGRNGRDGRFDGLGNPSDQKGRPLTNAELNSIFLSPEARQWRDVDFPALYTERDTLRASVKASTTQINSLQKGLASETAAHNITKDALAVSEARERSLGNDNKALKLQIAELEANQMPPLNGFGKFLWSLVSTISIKKDKE